MNNSQKNIIKIIVNAALDRAELHWANGGYKITADAQLRASNESYLNDSIKMTESKLPGHPWVSEEDTIISEFVAFVADMRDSTLHLLQEISLKTSKVTCLQRVFYETSALLPAIAKTIEFHEGKVTEYLGDGVLAFFKVDEKDRTKAMYASRRAAKDTLEETCPIINEILNARYGLPELEIGIGLAMSKAIVSLVGLPQERHPKAFGECVFRATKMSGGRNIICVDERMQAYWPKSENGRVRFTKKSFGEGSKKVTGYAMGYSS